MFNPGTLKVVGAAATPAAAQVAAPTAAGPSRPDASDQWDLSFRNLLDIVNPLEHLPVIGTLYRAATGEHIGTVEKIAGDALYGGLWGAVSGAADAAFEAVTGKDFGSTILALFTGDDSKAHLASNTPPAGNTSLADNAPMQSPNVAALSHALAQKGVASDLAGRALAAYRQSMRLPNPVPATLQ